MLPSRLGSNLRVGRSELQVYALCVSSKAKESGFSGLGYRISSYFSDSLFFTGPGRLISREVLEILLDKPKNQPAITAEHLRNEDREWLTVGPTPVDWAIDLVKFKHRFQIEDLPWLPEARIECKAEDLGDYMKIHIAPYSLGRFG